MTEERLKALHAVIAAAQEWLRCELGGRMITSLSQPEARLVQALDATEACGADVAVVVALNSKESG